MILYSLDCSVIYLFDGLTEIMLLDSLSMTNLQPKPDQTIPGFAQGPSDGTYAQ